jgi:hypothetical protein
MRLCMRFVKLIDRAEALGVIRDGQEIQWIAAPQRLTQIGRYFPGA